MKIIIEVTLTAEGKRLATTDPEFTNRFERAAQHAFRDGDPPTEVCGETDVPFARAVTVRAVQ